jgi:hypothetical protein
VTTSSDCLSQGGLRSRWEACSLSETTSSSSSQSPAKLTAFFGFEVLMCICAAVLWRMLSRRARDYKRVRTQEV